MPAFAQAMACGACGKDSLMPGQAAHSQRGEPPKPGLSQAAPIIKAHFRWSGAEVMRRWPSRRWSIRKCHSSSRSIRPPAQPLDSSLESNEVRYFFSADDCHADACLVWCHVVCSSCWEKLHILPGHTESAFDTLTARDRNTELNSQGVGRPVTCGAQLRCSKHLHTSYNLGPQGVQAGG